ncbi:MAG: DUF5107 domain-containing protein [Clostridia bacterium]|nr:DUF5107 domain-containing protein [Clostridia bacterium]
MSLAFSKYSLPSAHIGEDNTLPDIHSNRYIRSKFSVSDDISEEDGRYIGKGMISTILPYTVQDNYDRSREMRDFDCAVLENEYLKAVFVTELGGRLWSLFDKKNGRELLYKNDVFQPANLALRNAWFSGGIEWNVGVRGHNPLTVSPMFARKAYAKDGGEILKMYEYERIRGVTYSVCARLCADVLLVKVCIENNNDHDVPMYWWSNMAIPDASGTRIITPAEEMFYCSYEKGGYILNISKAPVLGDTDISYPANLNRSRDFFFKIPDGAPKWIAGVGGDGYGLAEFSTVNLKGRKLFVWGSSKGGRHWNGWLSDSGKNYVEIQAGLLRTQLEHFPMEKNSEISFIEGFSAITLPPETVNGEYRKAVGKAAETVSEKRKLLNDGAFDTVKEDGIAYYGSGWGALQNRVSDKPVSRYCEFPPESLSGEQEDWLALSDGKPLPDRDPAETVPSFVTGEYWEKAIEKTLSGNWYEYMQLGVIKYAKGDAAAAKDCFVRSAERTPNAWAYRDLAQIRGNIDGDLHAAARDMEKAADLRPDYVPLQIETATALMRCGEYGRWTERYEKLPAGVKENGRLRMLTGACYVRTGDTGKAKEYINERLVVADMMEGEYSLADIWCELYARVLAQETGADPETVGRDEVLARCPLPYELDFRMQ